MKITWEAEDIVGGLEIIQPEKGVTAVIGWNGLSDENGARRWLVVETNTDGMAHGQHKPADETTPEDRVWSSSDDKPLEIDDHGELVWTNYTREELARSLNNASYMWVPISLFRGNGTKLRYAEKDRKPLYPKLIEILKER